jgi:hypothetical protein
MRTSITSKQIQINKNNKKKDEFYKSLLGFWCLILTLLGMPWIIGYLIIDSRKTLVFSYIFTILNSSQGTIIFIFHCLLSKNVRDEMVKQLTKQIRRLFSSLKIGKKSNSDRGFSSNDIHHSNKLLKRRSNITSSLKNTHEKINEANKASSSFYSSSNTRQFRLVRHICNMIKSPKPSNLLSYSSTIDSNKKFNNSNHENNLNMTPISSNETNGSNESPIIYFNSSNRCNLENLHNQSAILINEDNGCSTSLIPSDNKYYITCKKYNKNNHTKSLIPLMYFSNDNHSQSFIGNIIQIPHVNSTINRDSSFLKRTFSNLNNSFNITNQDVNNQTPIVPPSLPPPLIYKNFYNLDIPITKLNSSNLKKSNYNNNENRFSTFKSNKNSSNIINENKKTNNNTFKKLELNCKDINFSKRLYTNYDENQYLTPEYHSYSIVDCKNFNESKDANENEDEIEGDLSSNYVEVIDEYLVNDHNPSLNKLKILNKINDNFLESNNYLNKSDDELFKITSKASRIDENKEKKINLLNKGLLAKTSSSLETSSPSSSFSSSSSNSSMGQDKIGLNIDSLNYKSQIIVQPNENSKAKKFLQRI